MKKTVSKKVAVGRDLSSEFVFMDKAVKIIEVGMATEENVILYGPGGHGKSELTMAIFENLGIDPYVITMGTGMTVDRLFGGLDIIEFEKTGKIEYLVENSFMNHEVVIFEELFDAPDFILEQLKDILSSRKFRNGSQVFEIKTKFIVCCTNRTREEFSKNMSLRALMERFPLELNVIWDNYTEHTYNKLLEAKFGVGNVDPIIPFLLQEYHKSSITISPRVAIKAYKVYEQCGPDALTFIAEFAKKPNIIQDTLKKYQSTIEFRDLSTRIDETIKILQAFEVNNADDRVAFSAKLTDVKNDYGKLKVLTVTDDIAQQHATVVKAIKPLLEGFEKTIAVANIMS